MHIAGRLRLKVVTLPLNSTSFGIQPDTDSVTRVLAVDTIALSRATN